MPSSWRSDENEPALPDLPTGIVIRDARSSGFAAASQGSPDRKVTRLEMQIDRRGDVVILRVSGEFDLSCKRAFESRTGEVLDQRLSSLIVDLRAVSFIDSTGLGLILELWSRARRDGWEFAVVKAPDQVHQVFETAGLDGALPMVDALPEESRT
jgi:anti-sigma B factor antagonist